MGCFDCSCRKSVFLRNRHFPESAVLKRSRALNKSERLIQKVLQHIVTVFGQN